MKHARFLLFKNAARLATLIRKKRIPSTTLHLPEAALKTFKTFDGATIAYHDEGEGSPVILLHGYGVDGLGQFGNFERILPILEKRQTLFIEAFGGAPG